MHYHLCAYRERADFAAGAALVKDTQIYDQPQDVNSHVPGLTVLTPLQRIGKRP